MKKLISILLCLCLVTAAVTAETEEEVKARIENEMKDMAAPIESTMTALSTVLATYSGANAVQHNVWDDAFIGKVFPSIIPHFGLGGTTAMTMVPVKDVTGLLEFMELEELTESLESIGGFPLPAIVGNARIGGIILPFDVGVSYMALNLDENMGDMQFGIEYKTMGIDVRYALVEQGVILPNVSVGLGYTKSQGSIGIDVNAQEGEASITGSITNTFDTDVFTGTVQVSKNLLGLFTPYVGARGSLVKGTYGWTTDFKATAEAAGESVTAEHHNSNKIDVKPGKDAGLDFQVFAGAGFKLFILDTSVGVSYDLTNKAMGVNTNFRIQL